LGDEGGAAKGLGVVLSKRARIAKEEKEVRGDIVIRREDKGTKKTSEQLENRRKRE